MPCLAFVSNSLQNMVAKISCGSDFMKFIFAIRVPLKTSGKKATLSKWVFCNPDFDSKTNRVQNALWLAKSPAKCMIFRQWKSARFHHKFLSGGKLTPILEVS